MEYCSMASGRVVGTISKAIWLRLRASKSASLFSHLRELTAAQSAG
jgi:hypothetical protein